MTEAANDNRVASRDQRKSAIMKHPVSGKEESVRYHPVGPVTLRKDEQVREAYHREQRKGKFRGERDGSFSAYYFKPPGYPHQVHENRDSVRDAMQNHSTFVNWEGVAAPTQKAEKGRWGGKSKEPDA